MKFHENLFQNKRNKGPQTYEVKYARGTVLQDWGSIFERRCNIILTNDESSHSY